MPGRRPEGCGTGYAVSLNAAWKPTGRDRGPRTRGRSIPKPAPGRYDGTEPCPKALSGTACCTQNNNIHGETAMEFLLDTLLGVTGVLLVLVILTLKAGIKFVPHNHAYVVERF